MEVFVYILSVYVCVCVSVCLSVEIFRTDHISAKLKEKYKTTFVDSDICHRIASLRKLHSVRP